MAEMVKEKHAEKVKEKVFNLDGLQINRLFPYYLLLDEKLRVISFGNSIPELCAINKNQPFKELFNVVNPSIQSPAFQTLSSVIGEVIHIQTINVQKILLKGTFELIPEEKQLLFTGSVNNEYNDFIEKKNAEEALIESEKRWKFALEGSGDGIWDWNIANNQVFYSRLWKEMIGYKEEEIENTLLEWEKRVHPDDLEKSKNDLDGYVRGISSVYQNEHRLKCKDGSYKWILTRGMIVERSIDGKPIRIIGTHTDINHIKQTDMALEQRVKQFQGLSENIPGVIFEYEARPDGTFGYKFISPAIEKIFGLPAQDFFDYTKYIHPDDLDEVEDNFKRSAETLRPYYNESRLILPQRGIVWRSISCSFSYFSDNGSKVFTGLMLDISERKKAEEKISESENRLSSLIANLQTGILVEDESRQLLLANELYCSLFDIAAPPKVLKGIDCSLFAEQSKVLFKHPEQYVERIVFLLKERKLAVDDLLELADGRIFSRDFVPIYYNNIYKGHLWKYNDITSQKNAEDGLRLREEKYRSIIANMNLGLMEVDLEEKILFVNQSFCDMCGFEMEELIGKRATEFFLKGDQIEMMESKNEARRRGHSDAYEMAVKNKRGQLKWWLISGAPRYNNGGDLIGSIGIHFDITNQKKLELDLIAANEAAEQSTRSKEVFLANMSHEIRTPMNAILGMTNQLVKTKLDSKQQFCLDTINSASENLLVIINDILDLSKIEAGKLSLEKIGFEPKAVIKRAIQVLMHRAEEKGLALKNVHFDDSISSVLIGDPYRINQVLLNIVSNAIKFTEKGGVEISCKLKRSNNNCQELEFSISDTGIGMDEQFVKNLFEKFSQEDVSVTRQYGGTGLGMSISKDLIELMGGSIFVKSKKNVGTTIFFIIEFPVGKASDLPNKDLFVADEGMLANKKILVVDDNDMNRLVATTILSSYGGITYEAANGKEALDFLLSNKVDIVLMDLQMPVMNGFDATISIRQSISTTLPIIALTANAIKGDRDKCMEVGMDDYVTKPFKEEDLMKIVTSRLNINSQINNNNMESEINPGVNYYDISDIRTISRGNEDFVKKMLKMFVEQTPGYLIEMREKFEARELGKLGEIAHKIKPTIDSMGIKSLKGTIRDIEKIAKTGIYEDVLVDLMKQVETDMNHAINAIKNDYQLT